MQYLMGATGGYLIGYLLAAFIVGKIAERSKTVLNAAMALTVGNLVVYTLGAGYLATIVGLKNAFFMGIAPFLMGDFFKTLVSLKLMNLSSWKRQSEN